MALEREISEFIERGLERDLEACKQSIERTYADLRKARGEDILQTQAEMEKLLRTQSAIEQQML